MFCVSVLQMPMPPHTLVMARNSVMQITLMDRNVEFTRAFSCRSVNMARPRRYSGRHACTARSRKPDSE